MKAPQEDVPGDLLQRLSGFARVHLLDTCPSTNDYAFSISREQQPAIVVCRTQTKGRGRFRRHWYSDSDSLAFSVLLVARQGENTTRSKLTSLSGLAVCLAVEELTGLKPLIRWPNDVVIHEDKLAGILCEQRKNAVAVGVGINVNQTSFPEDIPKAGSLRLATGRKWNKFELLERAVTRLFGLLSDATAGEDNHLLEAIRQRSSVLHHRVEVQTLFRRHAGTVIDLDAEGRLVLRTTSGRLMVVDSGQARRLR